MENYYSGCSYKYVIYLDNNLFVEIGFLNTVLTINNFVLNIKHFQKLLNTVVSLRVALRLRRQR